MGKETAPLVPKGSNSGGMAGNAPVIGVVCTVIGLFFSLYVYIDTSLAASKTVDLIVADVDVETESAWTRSNVITLLVGVILAILTLIAWIPVVLIEMEWCCCLGTVKETVLKAAFKSKGKIIKIIIVLLSLVAFALVLVYTIHVEIVKKEFDVLRNGIMSVVASIFLLVNLVLTLVYLRG